MRSGKRASITVAALNDRRVPTLRRTPLRCSRTLEPIAPQATTTARLRTRTSRVAVPEPDPGRAPVVDLDPARMALGHHARAGRDRLRHVGLERRRLAVVRAAPVAHARGAAVVEVLAEPVRGQRRVDRRRGRRARASRRAAGGRCRGRAARGCARRRACARRRRRSAPAPRDRTGAPSASQRASVSPRTMPGSSSRKQMQLLISVVPPSTRPCSTVMPRSTVLCSPLSL